MNQKRAAKGVAAALIEKRQRKARRNASARKAAMAARMAWRNNKAGGEIWRAGNNGGVRQWHQLMKTEKYGVEKWRKRK